WLSSPSELSNGAKISELECAGSADNRRTRLPLLAAANASADAHVVLPTPPFPPKKRILFLRRSNMVSNREGRPAGNDPCPFVDARGEILRGSTDRFRASKSSQDSAARKDP